MAETLAIKKSLTIHRPEKRRRIGNIVAFFLVPAALLIDATQFLFYLIGLIPFIGQVAALIFPPLIAVMAWIMFYLWFKLLGVDFMDGLMRKAVLMFSTAFSEMVPLVNAMPLWTLGIILMIAIVRVEDAVYNKQHQLS